MLVKHKSQLFLLGGQDLEMQTIRQLLEQKGFENITVSKNFNSISCFADKHLTWGAKLEHYSEFLSFSGKIFGIELIESDKIVIPDNYTRIDHHNDWSHKPSSLQQICEILDVPLNRYFKLVAANDSGYIPAMEAIGATPEEIKKIRRADRAAQGVTIIDEELAEQSIKDNLLKKDGILIVKSLTPKFSTITDRLYPTKRLLIYDDEHLVYYGIGMEKLIKYYVEYIEENKMFYGGGENGFLGTSKNSFSEKEINLLINEIVSICK